MPAIAVLLVPMALAALAAILAVTAAAERRILAPQALISRVARARGSAPEYAELMVAREVERLLRDAQKR